MTFLFGSSIAGAAPPGAVQRAFAPARCQPAAPQHADDAYGEFGECFTVAATLSSAPSVGQTAVLTVDIDSPVDRDSVEVSIALPGNLAWVRVPGRLSTDPDAAKSSGAGPVSTLTERRSVAAGQHLRYTGTIKALAAGPAEIQARIATRTGNPDRGAPPYS